MDDRQRDLSNYRIAEADDSLKVAEHCLKEGWDKDVMGYFNKEYVAKETFPREIGRRLGALQKVREKSVMISTLLREKKQRNSFRRRRSSLLR